MNAQSFSSAAIVLLGGLSLTYPGCTQGRDEQSRSAGAAALQIVPVETAAVERTHLTVTRLYTGSLEGEEQANVVAKISERVTSVNVAVGLRVRKGQMTVGLDKGGTSSQFYQAEAGWKNAGKTLERMKSLYSEGAVALQVLDGAQTAYDVAKANFDAARSAVELLSPIGGTVTAVNVSPGDLTTPGQVLVTVANIGRMKVIFSLNESDVTNVSLGHEAEIYSEARPGLKVGGRIVQLSKSADVRSRSFEVKALFPNAPDLWFKPGMFVKVTLHISPPGEVLSVPASAVQTDGTTQRVFVVRNGRSYLVPVVVGVTDGERTAVLQGLAEHDTVATTGANNLRDSSRVTVASR